MTAIEQTRRTDGGHALGKRCATYGRNVGLLVVGWFLIVLFGAIGLAMLWGAARLRKDVQFAGDVPALLATGLGTLALVALIAFVLRYLAGADPVFHLHEYGIRAKLGRSRNTVLFRDLEDIFTFPEGELGYRAAPGAPWIFVGRQTPGFAELGRRLRSLQNAQRGPVLARRLDAGEAVVFRYFNDSVGRARSNVALRAMDFRTRELRLTRDRLQVGKASMALDQLADIDIGRWTKTGELVGVNGRMLFSLQPGAILSAELLCTLITRQQRLVRA